MNQTGWIAASIFIGFLVYVTIKGELPAYKDAIFSGAPSKPAASPSVAEQAAKGAFEAILGQL
jgi:hypothetical protein